MPCICDLPATSPCTSATRPSPRWRGGQLLPEIRPGVELAALIVEHSGSLRDGDVLVVAQKVVSKAEGRIRSLTEVTPSERAVEMAAGLDADARMVQVVLDETAR